MFWCWELCADVSKVFLKAQRYPQSSANPGKQELESEALKRVSGQFADLETTTVRGRTLKQSTPKLEPSRT